MIDLSIAEEIIRQLGGARFCLMTGARDILGWSQDDNGIRGGVRFKLGRNAGRVSLVVIQLTVMDEYTVTFYTGPVRTMREMMTFDHIYADNLAPLISRATGLDTTLGAQTSQQEVSHVR